MQRAIIQTTSPLLTSIIDPMIYLAWSIFILVKESIYLETYISKNYLVTAIENNAQNIPTKMYNKHKKISIS